MEEDKIIPAEETPQTSGRDRMVERLKKKYPDKEYADDEALYGQINDDYDDYDKQLESYRDTESKIVDAFGKNRKAAKFFADMVDGKNPLDLLVEELGIDGVVDLINSEEGRKEYAKANEAYLDKVAKDKELEEEFNSNFEATRQMLDQLVQEGKDETAVNEAYKRLCDIMDSLLRGTVTREDIEMVLKAQNYDGDVAEASETGRIEGRNEKIEETYAPKSQGDGLPNLGGAANPVSPTPKRRSPSIFEEARYAK